MAKILAFDLTRRKTPPPTRTAGQCPAVAWLIQRKEGRSRSAAASQLNVIARILGYGQGKVDDWRAVPWGNLRRTDALKVRAALAAHVAADTRTPASANVTLNALRGVLKESWRAGYMDADEHATAADLKAFKGNRLRRPRRVLSEEEFAKCLAVCEADHSAAGVRDAALFALAAACGLRAGEYAALQVDDYDRKARLLQVRSDKTGDARQVPLAGETTVYLEAWLSLRGTVPGPLFVRLERGGATGRGPLTSRGVSDIMTARGEEAGVERFTSHATRRGFVTRAAAATHDLGLVSKLIGHSSPAVTAQSYFQPQQEELRAAVETIGLPKLKEGA